MSGTLIYQSPALDGDGNLTLVITKLNPPVTPNPAMTVSVNLTSTGFIFNTGTFDTGYFKFTWESTTTEVGVSQIQIGVGLTPLYPSNLQIIYVILPTCSLNGQIFGFSLTLNKELIALAPSSIVSNFSGTFSPRAPGILAPRATATNFDSVLQNVSIGSADLQSLFPTITDFNVPVDITCYHECCYIKTIINKKEIYKKIIDLKPGNYVYTINNKTAKIKGIYKFNINREIVMIKIKKDSIATNYPLYDIYLTMGHMIMHNGKKINAVDFPNSEKKTLYVEYIYHILIDKKCDVDFINCSNIYTDVWGLYNRNAEERYNNLDELL